MSEKSGLYDKYEVYEDGEPVDDCFVLEPESDEAARVALWAYAMACDDDELQRDIITWIAGMEGPIIYD